MSGIIEAVTRELAGSHWPLLVFSALILVLVGAILLTSWLLGEGHRGRWRDTPFESGVPPTGSARLRVPIHYYLVALFFLVFDVEVAFIFAWAVAWRELGWSGYAEMVVFVGVLLAGLIYAWKKGALDWLAFPGESARQSAGGKGGTG